MTNQEFLYKYDNKIKFTEAEIISMCKGKVGTDIKFFEDEPEADAVVCEFTVDGRRFYISYMGAHEAYGQAWDDDFWGSYPEEVKGWPNGNPNTMRIITAR